MDPVALLAATVAMVAFPGGAFAVASGLAAAAGALPARARRGAGEPASDRLGGVPDGTLGLLAALALAASLVPLPGSPARSLPGAAAADNVVAVVALLAVAGAVARDPGRRWTATGMAATTLCGAAVLVLGAVGASFAPDVVSGLGDVRGTTARLLAGAAIVLVAPTLADLGRRAGAAARCALVGVAAAFAVAIGEPSPLASSPGVVSALAALAAAAAAGCGSLLPPRLREVLAGASAAAAIAVAGTLL